MNPSENQPHAAAFPWESVFTLVCVHLRMSPQDFWQLTMPELAMLLRGVSGHDIAPLDRKTLIQLAERFPDGEKNDK